MGPSDVKLEIHLAAHSPTLFSDLPDGAFFHFKPHNGNKRKSGGLRQKSRGGYVVIEDSFLSPGYFRESPFFQKFEVILFDITITARERTS